MDINTKFNVGDTVYFMSDNKIKSDKVEYIRVECREGKIDVLYELEHSDIVLLENTLYRYVDDLIYELKANIEVQKFTLDDIPF